MSPERVAAIVVLWARLYTLRLPEEDARGRIEELRADLHDHVAYERAHGTGERRIAARVAARMFRGMAADVAWRRDTARRPTSQEAHMHPSSPARRSAVRVATVTALVLLVPLVAMLVGDGADWGVFDFVFAGAIIAGAGMLIELALRSRGTAAYVAAAVGGVLGVLAIVAGEADDAPGLVGFGLLLVLGMTALTFRTVQRSG